LAEKKKMGKTIEKESMTFSFRIYLSAFVAVLFLLPSAVSAATLNFSPIQTTVPVGGTITETVFVSSADQAMNAIEGAISFPSDILQVVSVSKTNSVLSLWVQEPTFSNANGTISFSGVVPNPGYTGNRGQIISIQFRGKQIGSGPVVFSSSSQVLANDGNGTDILNGTQSATITVVAPIPTPASAPAPSSSVSDANLLARITSSTHPDQTQWYNLPHAVFDWTNAQGVSAIRLGYDKNADGKPSVVYTDPISHKELDLADGIWYFHVQEKASGGWGPVASYRVQIDTAPPLPFTVTFPNGTTTQSGGTLTTQFTARDELSGIDHYQVAVDGKEFAVTTDEGNRPYTVSGDTGTHMLLVRAYDKAGNISTADAKFFVRAGEPSPSSFNLFTFGWLAINYLSLFLILLAILITLIFAAWYIRTHFTAYRRRLNRQLGITHTHIHKEFDKLKDAITDELLSLEQTKSKRSLTHEEERLIGRFKKLLEQSEEQIEKDIEDIQR
jgi:hypothetical protein